MVRTYTFDPETGLDFNNGNHNPIFIGLEDATYNVTVTDGLCTVEGSIDVDVEESLELTIEGEELVVGGDILLSVEEIPLINENNLHKSWLLMQELKKGDTFKIKILRFILKINATQFN